MTELFARFARSAAQITGSAPMFMLALLIVVAWALSGPIFGFNDTWQLAINTGTTIVTFLMVFLIQSSQNRDSIAIQLKLDELIHSSTLARDEMIDLEDDPEEVVERERERFRALAKHLQQTSGGKFDLAKTLEEALEKNGTTSPSQE